MYYVQYPTSIAVLLGVIPFHEFQASFKAISFYGYEELQLWLIQSAPQDYYFSLARFLYVAHQSGLSVALFSQ